MGFLFDATAHNFFFETPLYTKIKLDETEDDFNALKWAIDYSGKVDAYNPTLGENTTFQIASETHSYDAKTFANLAGFKIHRLVCVRTNEMYKVFSHFDSQTMVFQKIGQYLSIADMHISKVKRYDKVLNKEKLKEFTRAIGLAANGVGIGSFVYLRRIFEDLILEAYNKAKVVTGWNDEEYGKSRMAERIVLLKDYLPEFLVENHVLYGILSKGIHSLEENECLGFFEPIKVGIELILDEKLDQLNKQKKVEDARAKIAAIASQHKST